MKELLNKLLKINLWNIIFSLFNLLSSFLIVRVLGVSILGEYTVVNVYIAFSALIIVAIPPNLAVYKYQDEADFPKIHSSYFVCVSLISGLILAVSAFVFLEIEVCLLYLIAYAVGIAWNNYFDVYFQARGLLKEYYKFLTIIAVSKCLLIVIFFYFGQLKTIDDLLVSQLVSQLSIIIIYLYRIKFFHRDKFVSVSKLVGYMKSNIRLFIPYYFSSSLKVCKEQIDIIIFNLFISKEVLGIFSLFTKSITFFNSLIRVIESYFINRKNIKNDYDLLFRKSIVIGFIFQIGYMLFNTVYVYIMIRKFLIIETIIASFFFLFAAKFIMVRQKMLSNFDMRLINISQISYILVSVLLSILCYYLCGMDIMAVLSIYVISNLVSQKIIITGKTIRRI